MALITEYPALVEPEVRIEPRASLTTSVPTLDRILGPFEAGRLTLLDSGSDFVHRLTTLLCVRAIMDGRDVVFVDGGNSVDPHGMVALGKRAGLRREEVLPRVHVARAFTCHQMTTLLLDTLDNKLQTTDAGLVVLACLPSMYLDEDVDRDEAHALFRRSLRAAKRAIADADVIGLATNAGLARLYRRKSIRRELYEGADRIVRMVQGRGGVLLTRLDTGTAEWYRPVRPDQTTLDDYEDPRPRIVDLATLGVPREIRTAEHLRLGW